MRAMLLSSVLVLTAACSSSSDSGGAVNLTFGATGATVGGVFTTSPAGAMSIQGQLSVSGDYEGQYTLATSIPSGSPLATCLVSVDGGTPSTSVAVDESSGQTHAVTVQIGLGAAYQGQGVCNVAATNNAKPNIGDTVIIQIQGAGDAGS